MRLLLLLAGLFFFALGYAQTPSPTPESLPCKAGYLIRIAANGQDQECVPRVFQTTGKVSNVAVSFGGIAKGACEEKPVNVPGAEVGNTVSFGASPSLHAGALSVAGYVSAPGVVTVKRCSLSTAVLGTASGTVTLLTFKP